MVVIYVLLGISVLMASIFLLVFLWNLRSGQYEDDYTPAIRMLFDDTVPAQSIKTPQQDNQTNQ
ncbi:cytochrome C oxidase Cbb3 [bacterium 336/3]|jgi:cbb3-type cytochrome oxidase maturation protein|nr:cytochrome C oxidase Cbb3 [bacterium 336/3]